MSGIAFAIAGAGLLAGSGTVGAAMIGANAAKAQAGAMQDASVRAEMGLTARFAQALSFLAPYQQYGLQAGATLSSAFTSPQDTLAARAQERIQLEGAIPRALSWPRDAVLLSGKNASERAAVIFTQNYNARNQEIEAAQAKLATFDQQTEALKQQYAADVASGRDPNVSPYTSQLNDILNRYRTNVTNTYTNLEKSPLYQVGSEMTARALAARGLTNSGEAIRQQGTLSANLAGTAAGIEGQITQSELAGLNAGIAGLFGLYGTGSTAAGQGAQTAGVFAPQIAGTQMAYGQYSGQGLAGQQWQNAITGMGATGGSLLNYAMYSQMIKGLNSGGTQNADLYNLNNQMFGTSSQGGNAFGGTSTIGPQLNTGVQPFNAATFAGP